MFGGMDDFESGIDINSILNDTSLHDELASLGWVDHGPPAVRQPVKQAKGTTVPKPESQPALVPIMPDTIEHLDIGSIGLVDENMEFTEADAQDEGLLAEFALISGEHAPQQGHSEPEEDEPPATGASLHAAPTPQSTVPVQAPVKTRPPPPAASVPPASQTTAPPSANGIPTVEEAKRNALKFKREGNNTEALKWLRLSKQIENGTFQGASDLPTSPAVTSSGAAPSKAPKPAPSAGKKPAVSLSAAPAAPATNPFSTLGDEPNSNSGKAVIGNDIFGPLESAIQEASKAALRDAKYAEREKDTKQALVKMREYKALQQELTVLLSRRNTPGAAPALFHWETVRKETVIENKDIAEDEVKLTIEGVYDIAGIVETHTSRSLSVSYQLGIAKDDAPPVVVPAATYADGRVVYHYEIVLPILKRGRNVQALYQRKKAVFDLVLHKGFWKGNETLCQAVLPLTDLLTKSKIGGQLQLKTVADNGSSKKGKVVGGQMTVYVAIRSPLSGPEIVVTEERKLVLQPWPTVRESPALSAPIAVSSAAVSGAGTPVPTQSTPVPGPLTSVSVTPVPSQDPSLPTPPLPPKPILTGALATLTDQERNDPHSVDFIESNDVLEMEITAAETLLRTSHDEDEQFNANMRLQLLRTKLQLLVYQVQNDQLSLEDYLEKVKARVKRDQVMALYFKTLGDQDSVATALAMMKRVGVMKKEIQNAEEAGNEE